MRVGAPILDLCQGLRDVGADILVLIEQSGDKRIDSAVIGNPSERLRCGPTYQIVALAQQPAQHQDGVAVRLAAP